MCIEYATYKSCYFVTNNANNNHRSMQRFFVVVLFLILPCVSQIILGRKEQQHHQKGKKKKNEKVRLRKCIREDKKTASCIEYFFLFFARGVIFQNWCIFFTKVRGVVSRDSPMRLFSDQLFQAESKRSPWDVADVCVCLIRISIEFNMIFRQFDSFWFGFEILQEKASNLTRISVLN